MTDRELMRRRPARLLLSGSSVRPARNVAGMVTQGNHVRVWLREVYGRRPDLSARTSALYPHPAV